MSKNMVNGLSGHEIVEVNAFAIAYNATLRSPDGKHGFGTMGPPTMIQPEQIPEELHKPILALIRRQERKRWGLPELGKNGEK